MHIAVKANTHGYNGEKLVMFTNTDTNTDEQSCLLLLFMWIFNTDVTPEPESVIALSWLHHATCYPWGYGHQVGINTPGAWSCVIPS